MARIALDDFHNGKFDARAAVKTHPELRKLHIACTRIQTGRPDNAVAKLEEIQAVLNVLVTVRALGKVMRNTKRSQEQVTHALNILCWVSTRELGVSVLQFEIMSAVNFWSKDDELHMVSSFLSRTDDIDPSLTCSKADNDVDATSYDSSVAVLQHEVGSNKKGKEPKHVTLT